MKKLWPIFVAVFCYLTVVKSVFATDVFSFSIKEIDKSSLSHKEEEVKVTLTINKLPSESYFRVAFQPKSGGVYFGYIKNETGEWTKIKTLSSGDCSGYYHITDTSTSELTIGLIIGGENEVNSDEYLIKGHRFTASCPKSGYTESTNSVAVNFSFPSSSPSPTPSSSANPPPNPSSNPSSNQPAPSPSPVASASPSATPQPSKIYRIKEIALLSLSPEPVLGTQSSQTKERGGPDWQLAVMLLATGAGLLLTTAVIIFKLWRKN